MLLLSSLSLSFSLFNSTVTFGVCLPTQPNLDNSSQACPDAPFLDDSWGCQVDNQCKQSQCFVIFFIKFLSELLQKKRKKIDHHCPKYLEYLFHLLTHQIYNVTDYDDKIEKKCFGDKQSLLFNQTWEKKTAEEHKVIVHSQRKPTAVSNKVKHIPLPWRVWGILGGADRVSTGEWFLAFRKWGWKRGRWAATLRPVFLIYKVR